VLASRQEKIGEELLYGIMELLELNKIQAQGEHQYCGYLVLKSKLKRDLE